MAIGTGKLKALISKLFNVKITWRNNWQETTYQKRDMVDDDGWLMVANKPTSDQAAPQSLGEPAYLLPDIPAWIEQSNISSIHSGHFYQFKEPGWIRALRVWVPEVTATTTYRIVLLNITDPDNPVYAAINNPQLNDDNWTTVVVGDSIVKTGTQLLVYIDALNTSANTQFTGDWTYGGISNTGAPANESWNRRSQQDTVRIDYDDLTSTDRSADLASIIPGSTLQFVETAATANFYTYITTGAGVDNGTYYTFPVSLTLQGAGGVTEGEDSTLTATIPTPQSTKYEELADYWLTNQPVYADITGFLEYDGVDQGGDDDAFGVDIAFERASVSDDWDFAAFTDIASSPGAISQIGQPETFKVVEADAAYNVLIEDDAINCDGTFTVTFPPILSADKAIVITSTNGTVTVAGDATIQGTTSITTGTGSEWYPARGQWWRR